MEVPRQWIGKSLVDLQLHRKRDVTVLAIKGRGEGGALPRPQQPLREGDVLVMGGKKKALDGLDPSDV
jgi:trk system potassium uptake protein